MPHPEPVLMTTTPEAAERARFEAWAGEKGYVTTLSVHVRYRTFVSRSTECAWIGWQARAALAAQEGGSGERVTDHGFENMRQAILNAVEDYCAEAPDLAGHGHSGSLKDVVNEAIRAAQEGTGNG